MPVYTVVSRVSSPDSRRWFLYHVQAVVSDNCDWLEITRDLWRHMYL